MKIFLDTRAFLWLVADAPELSQTAKTVFRDADNNWREGQTVKVIVQANDQESPRSSKPSLLSGEAALQKAREIGFIGGFEAEPNLSVRYKEEIDWPN